MKLGRKNQIFTQVVYVNLQVLEELVDDIVILIQLNHLNNVNDDSKKKKNSLIYYLISQFYM
jgi:hypothetical protein